MKLFICLVCVSFLCLSDIGTAAVQRQGSLCAAGEQIVFSCTLKRPAKMLALCASPNLSKASGYIQYRYGLPGKIELEFPKARDRSMETFSYRHYFRAQVDETEISFTNEGTSYSIFDDYNGEEKPALRQQGIVITPSGSDKEVRLVCNGRAKIDFSKIENVLPRIE